MNNGISGELSEKLIRNKRKKARTVGQVTEEERKF